MTTAEMMERNTKGSPGFKARIAGVFYVLAVFTAVCGELFFHGRLGYALGLIAVACYVAVTLSLYDIFKAVNRSLSLLAAGIGLAGLTFEALRLHPWGLNMGMIFHTCYCLIIGYLIFRSTFLPRILGALMGAAGLIWQTNLWPSLANLLSTYTMGPGLLGEGLPMLRLLVMGGNVQRWKEQAKWYSVDLDCQKAIIALLTPGHTYEEAEAAGKAIFDKASVGNQWYGWPGHFVGLATHDVMQATGPVRPGQVVTVEPIIEFTDKHEHYRVEDTVLITNGAPEILSSDVPKEIGEVEKLVGSAQ